MKRRSAAAFALAAGTLAIASAQPAKDPLDTLLFAAISAPATVSYTGTIQVVRMGTRAAEAAVCRVEHRAPNLTKRAYTSPSALAGDSVVSRGDLIFSVDPHHRRIVETRNDAAGDSTELNVNYALLRQNYTIAGEGSESFDGRRTIDLALVNKYSHRTTMLVRVDTATKIVLDKEEFAPDGALVGEQRFEEIRYSAQLPAADFAVPKGFALVRGGDRVVSSPGFAVREPHSLTDGFSPVASNFVEMRGVRTAHLLYSDGIRTVSLFENATASTLEATRFERQWLRVGGRTAEYAEDGATALLAWSDGTLHYTLVGEVGLVDLPRLASSISP
jgi:negative regulator of sigma E activity